MNSNGVLNSNRFVEKLGIQMLLRNVVIYMLLFTHHYPARCFGMNTPKFRDIRAKIPSKIVSQIKQITYCIFDNN